MNSFNFQFLSAEFEADLISERTQARLSSARAKGRLGGKPKKLDNRKLKRMKELYESKEMTVEEIRARFGVSKGTFYRSLCLD